VLLSDSSLTTPARGLVQSTCRRSGPGQRSGRADLAGDGRNKIDGPDDCLPYAGRLGKGVLIVGRAVRVGRLRIA